MNQGMAALAMITALSRMGISDLSSRKRSYDNSRPSTLSNKDKIVRKKKNKLSKKSRRKNR